MSVQIYIATKTFEAPPTMEEDEMLDFEDIGGIYNDPSVTSASSNTSVLSSFLNSQSGSQGISLMFSGNRNASYNNKRMPQPVYFRLASGPISNIATATNHADVQFTGLVGTRLIGVDSQSPTTPLFLLQRRQGTFQKIILTNLVIENNTGSGIKLTGTTAGQGPGQGCILSGVKFTDIGMNLPAQTFDRDGFTDLDTVPYAIYVDEADGCFITDCIIEKVNGNGIVSTRWHDGIVAAGARECMGSGFKLRRANGLAADLRAESNAGWGVHVERSGNETSTTGGLIDEQGGPNAWDIWMESNNARESTSYPYGTSTGYTWRQMKIDSSSRLTIGGHTGWRENKIHVSEGVRRSNRFIESDYIDPSADGSNAVMLYDMNSDGVSAVDGINDNWSTVWPNVGDRPSMTTVGDTATNDLEVQIDVPSGAYDDVQDPAVGAWWKIQVPTVTAQDGDMLIWDAQISVDAGGYQYCIDREAIVGANRMPGWLGSFGIWGAEGATTNLSMWSSARRKFSNRIHVQDSRSVQMIVYIYFQGMGDVASTGLMYPETALQLRIHSLRLIRGA